MRRRRQASGPTGKGRRWIGLSFLAPALVWGQPSGGPNVPAFRLNPPEQAPAYSVAADAVEPGGAPEANSDPRAAQLTRWLREQLAQKPAVPTNSPPQVEAGRAAARQAALDRLQTLSGGDVRVRFRPANGTPLLIKGRLLERRFSGIAKAGANPDEQTARAFLRANAALLRLVDPDQELQLVVSESDDLGHRHLRFRQLFQGLPVWPCELKVHLDADGNVYLLDGAFVPTPADVNPAARLTSDQAIQAARAAVTGDLQAEATPPELVIHAPLDRPARLAWKFDLTVGLSSAWRCLIDAETGALLAQINLCPHGAVNGSGLDDLGVQRPLGLWEQGVVYHMVNTAKPMFNPASDPLQNPRGAIVILDARNQPPTGDPRVIGPSLRQLDLFHSASASANSGWVPDAVGAAFGFSQTYDYYLARHNRNSLDGNGGNIVGVVRLGVNFFNAFWNGQVRIMYFGDHFTRAVDVCGHELTHGVINSLGNGGILEYHRQSGALNEAFADIFGEMVEAYTLGGRSDWLKGQGLPVPFPVQDYADPNAKSQIQGRPNPARMSQFVELPDTEESDSGGVHINSSIINHCFYLLAEGLEGAIGLRDAERIFYRALTLHLDKQSQFIDARHACLNAAETLFGENSPQVRKTAEAFDAVEIFDSPETPDPSPVPTVQSPDATLALRLDPQAGQYYLVRSESARGDPATGTALNTLKYLAPRRVSVTGDGARAFYVTSDHDLGIVETDGTNPRVADHPGLVHSLAAAPDGTRFAFVLLDEAGRPTKSIRLVDFVAQTERDIPLYSPGTEGARLDIIQFADVMDFTADGQTLIYDAYAEIAGPGGQVFRGWALYALDLQTDTIRTLIDLNEELDFGNPSLGNTRNHLLTFEVVNKATGVSTVFAADLSSNEVKPLGAINPPNGLGVPGYVGDDRAIVYAQGDSSVASGFSLVRQPLAADGFTPSGQPTVWMRDADVGVVYRRGQFVSSNALPTVRLANPAPGQQFTPPASITLQAIASDPDGRVARVEFYNGSTRLSEDTTSPYSFTWPNVPAGEYRLLARAVDNLGAVADSDPVQITVGGGKPDLVSPSIDLTPQPAVEGQTVTLTTRIRNAGAAPAPATRARVFLSPTDDFNTADDFAFPQPLTVPALAAGQETEVSAQFQMPNLGSGSYSFWALVQVDSDNTVDEANEANLFRRTNPLTAQDASGQAPVITTQPQSQTVTAGATVTFTVTATGTPPPSYQWRKDGQDLPGQTSATLTLVNVQPAHAGTYTVRVTNSAGQVTSNPATLTVNPTDAPRHPADVNPPDNRLTLQEVIAYAAAYKRDQFWPEGPNPIPLDYMIRAATLYKRGETYRHDPAAGPDPVGWVNVPPP